MKSRTCATWLNGSSSFFRPLKEPVSAGKGRREVPALGAPFEREKRAQLR